MGRLERMWDGMTAVVLASGPSMTPAVVETVRQTSYRVIAINTTFRLAPWADLIYAADAKWWETYQVEVNELSAVKVAAEPTSVNDVVILKPTGKLGFDPDPSNLRTGGNSGYQAIHCAIHLGCRRILLCGMDMRGGHWHGRHPSPLRDHGEAMYAKWIPNFDSLIEPLRERNVEVINCTPNSALKCFPFGRLEDLANASRLSVA